MNILKDIIRETYHRYIPPDVEIIERNGYVFFAHPRRRFDPITLAVIAMGAGTGIGIANTLKGGKQTEKIANARAEIDIQNAEAARRSSVEKSKIKGERGRRLIETQKSTAAAGGVRINVGSPLVIEAQTRADIATDIGFILERGRTESNFYRSRAAVERATGKAARRKSKWDAISQGLMSAGSIAFMGSQAGMFSKTPISSRPGSITFASGGTSTTYY